MFKRNIYMKIYKIYQHKHGRRHIYSRNFAALNSKQPKAPPSIYIYNDNDQVCNYLFIKNV